MQVLKNIAFGLTHGFIWMASTGAIILMGIFWVAKPVAEYMLAAGFNPWLALITATAGMIAPVFLFAWKVLLPYVDWLEPELRRRERLACKLCKTAASTGK